MSRISHWRRQFRRWRDPLAGCDAAQWLTAAQQASSPVVAVVNPDWRGVYSSTTNLFPVSLPVRNGLTKRSARRVADLLIQTGASHFVFGGLPPTHVRLIEALRQAGQTNLYALWYGNFMQSGASLEWRAFCAIKHLLTEKKIRKIGFAKSGMAEAFQRLNLPASFVLNAIDQVPAAPSQPEAGGPHLGIAAVNLRLWRKLPFAMLAAAAEISGAKVHLVGADARIMEFVQQLSIDADLIRKPIPQTQMPDWLRTKHLMLYVTLSECCPMLPLESLAVGVPCLLGPSSHLFEEDGYLHSRLVVPYPDRHEVIAKYVQRALAERDEIVAAYARWLPGYVRRSRQSVAEFLDLPMNEKLETNLVSASRRIDGRVLGVSAPCYGRSQMACEANVPRGQRDAHLPLH